MSMKNGRTLSGYSLCVAMVQGIRQALMIPFEWAGFGPKCFRVWLLSVDSSRNGSCLVRHQREQAGHMSNSSAAPKSRGGGLLLAVIYVTRSSLSGPS